MRSQSLDKLKIYYLCAPILFLGPQLIESSNEYRTDPSMGSKSTGVRVGYAADIKLWMGGRDSVIEPVRIVKGNFSRTGVRRATSGYGITVHPLRVCAHKQQKKTDPTLKDNVAVIMLNHVPAFISGCVCPLPQIYFAQNSGASAVILGMTNHSRDETQFAACEKEMIPGNRSSAGSIRIPVVKIYGAQLRRLKNIIEQSSSNGLRLNVRIESRSPTLQKPSPTEKQFFDDFTISEFNVGVVVASSIFMCGICSIIFLKLKWRARHRALTLDLAKQALADMEIRKFRKPVVRRTVEDAANMFGFSGRKSTSKLLSSAKRAANFTSKTQKLSCDLTGSKFSIASSAHELCVVCLEEYRDGVELRVLPCGHEFHKLCVDPWLLTGRTCPLCQFDVVLRRYPGEDSKDVESGLLNSSSCVLNVDGQSMAALRAELTLPLLLEEVPSGNVPSFDGHNTPTVPIEFLARNTEFHTPSRLHRYCADPLCRRQRENNNRRASRIKKVPSAPRPSIYYSPNQPTTSNQESLPIPDHSNALRSPLSDFTSDRIVIHQPNTAISPTDDRIPSFDANSGSGQAPIVFEKTGAEASTTSAASVIGCPYATRSRSRHRKHSLSSRQRKKRPHDQKTSKGTHHGHLPAIPPTRQEIIAAYRRHMEFISKYPPIQNKNDSIPTISMPLPKELKADPGYLSDVSAMDTNPCNKRSSTACRRGSVERDKLFDNSPSKILQIESPVVSNSFSASSVQNCDDPPSTDDSSDFFLPAAPFVRFFEQEKEKNRLKPARTQGSKPSSDRKPVPIRQPQTALCESPLTPTKDPSEPIRLSATFVRDNSSLISPTKAFSSASRGSEII